MRNEEDYRWQVRWPKMKMKSGTEIEIINVDPEKLLRVLKGMNFLHMNDATRAMLRDRYPEVFEQLIEAEYEDAEQKLLVLLRASK
jgi:hypothetical protein